MSLYRLKVTPRKNPDIYRIIDIVGVQHFEVLHRAIIKSMKFTEGELASFYINYDEPDNKMEICLSDVQGGEGENLLMKEVKVMEIFSEENKKITYVYDFMNFWIFDIELLEILSEKKPNIIYPHISESIGTAPVQENIDNDDFDDEDTKLIADLMKNNKGLFDDELMDDFNSDNPDIDPDDYPDDDNNSYF